MGKNISFKNHDRFIHLGIAIAALRKMRGMSRNDWLKRRGSAVPLSAPLKRRGWQRFSLDVFFNLADALDIDPADLIDASVFPDPDHRKK